MADEDPFELFKNTFMQFNTPGTVFDPSQFAMFGWPMTPLPVQGVPGSGTEMTPEAGTKRAVTQLFSAIETLEENPLSAGSVPEGWEQILGGVTLDQFATEGSPESIGRFLLDTYQAWLQSLSQLLVENYTIRVLYDELVVAPHRNETSTYEWLFTLSQPDREQLLLRCTDLEDELVDEMEALRTQRNELLYGLGGDEASTNPVEDGRRYMQLLQALDDAVENETSYDFFPEGSPEGTGRE